MCVKIDPSKDWPHLIVCFALAYGVATLTATLAILAMTRSLETVPAGLLVPVFVPPSILGYIVLGYVRPKDTWKHLSYLVPTLGLFVLLAIGLFAAWMDGDCMGVDLCGIALGTFGPSAGSAYAYLMLHLDAR